MSTVSAQPLRDLNAEFGLHLGYGLPLVMVVRVGSTAAKGEQGIGDFISCMHSGFTVYYDEDEDVVVVMMMRKRRGDREMMMMLLLSSCKNKYG